jgi:plastocyanin
MAITPCNSATNYVSGTSVAVGDATTIGYMPACLKVAPGTTVTIGASQFHPLSARSGGSPNNPIGMHQMTPQTVTFPTAGFFPFQCDIHFSLGMMGVIWVSP